jgi:cohesin loading factor subunit SCC2
VVNQGFTNIYKLVNGTRSTRFKFLRALLRRYEGKSSGSDATYLCFLANAIGALPFTMSDEVLFVIFHLNRIISLRASTLQDSLAKRIEQAEAAGIEEPPEDLREDVELSLSASIMLSLKRHLKLTYDLADARTQAYNPAEALKSAEAFRYDEDASDMDLSWCDPAAGDTVAGCRAQADLFARLMQSDADDYGEYAPASRKRGRPKKARAVDDDDDTDDSDDDDDEPFSPAIPKTASIASPRGGKGTPRGNRARWGGSSTPTPRKRLAL